MGFPFLFISLTERFLFQFQNENSAVSILSAYSSVCCSRRESNSYLQSKEVKCSGTSCM